MRKKELTLMIKENLGTLYVKPTPTGHFVCAHTIEDNVTKLEYISDVALTEYINDTFTTGADYYLVDVI